MYQLFGHKMSDLSEKSVQNSQGNISVKKISEIAKINRRSLERQFQDKIGLTPKVFAQVYRFKCTMNFLEQNPGITWTELSNSIDYFDQAHMIRYFKKYIKVSPNNLATIDLDVINYLLHH